MKYTVFALVAIFALASAEYKIRTPEDLNNVRKECVELKKVPADYVEKFKKFDFPDDETTRCYLECVLNKFEMFDAKKEGFQIDNMVKQMGQGKNETEVRAEIEKCADKNEQKSDSCTWAYRGFKCFISKNLQLVKSSLKQN